MRIPDIAAIVQASTIQVGYYDLIESDIYIQLQIFPLLECIRK